MERRPRETAGKRLWPKLKPESQRMRIEPTSAEDVLWQRLRGGKLGVRFRRQHAIDRFLVDFVCLQAKLIVEVDGEVHEAQAERDQERDATLQGSGYHVVRFPNDQVLNGIASVIDDIRTILRDRPSSNSPLHPERGGTPKA